MIINTNNLTHHYGRRIGIQSLTLQVKQGTLFGFLGPNGSGKTTAIRILLGLLRPTQGSARIFDMDCTHESARIKAQIGYLPGDLRLYNWMTIRKALKIIGQVRRRDIIKTGLNLAGRFELDPTLPVAKMSRGNKQKAGLIMAMAHNPKLLILDEPTTSLDPLVQNTLFQYLQELAQTGVTIFFSSHTLSEVERLCDEVAILRTGRLVAHESIADLRSQAGREVTIIWKPNTDLTQIKPPPGLNLHQQNHHQWTATFRGNTPDLIKWLTTQPIQDITLTPPDLARVFQSHYSLEKPNT